MISPSKFIKLRKITKYFKIAEELKFLRDGYLTSGSIDLSNLEVFRKYLSFEPEALYINEIVEIIEEPDPKISFERIHFLYHRIKDDFGYPVPESEFVKSSKDSQENLQPKTDLVIILENLRSAFNVGSIIRSCECFGVKELILFGMTPGTENDRTVKTAKGTEKNVLITCTAEIRTLISVLREKGYLILGAETGSGSSDLRDIVIPERTAIIFGNEEIGITQETLGLCDKMISIKMRGIKNSLNVSNAVSIFLYEYSKNKF